MAMPGTPVSSITWPTMPSSASTARCTLVSSSSGGTGNVGALARSPGVVVVGAAPPVAEPGVEPSEPPDVVCAAPAPSSSSEHAATPRTVATATSTAAPRRPPPFHQPDIVFSLACLTGRQGGPTVRDIDPHAANGTGRRPGRRRAGRRQPLTGGNVPTETSGSIVGSTSVIVGFDGSSSLHAVRSNGVAT